MKTRSLLIIFCLGISSLSRAQYQGDVFLEDSTIKVYEGGVQRQLAWCGGFNNPQFAMGDLNHDGKPDLVIFEDPTQQIKTFLNMGTATSAYYVYAPKYAKNFPPVYAYMKLEDYNRDGIPDLIDKGAGGFRLMKGYYNNNSELCFTYYKDLRFNSPNFGNINAYSQNGDIPGVADVDHDGDLDFLGYNEQGAIIYFYKNCQVENNMPNDSVIVCLPSNCWGATAQYFGRAFTLGIVTGGLCPTIGTFGCKQTMHQGNTMLVFDIDGDGDLDMLDGNISFSDLQLLVNGRAQYGGKDSMVSQDTLWQSSGIQVNMPQWPAAFYVDADGDGKKDLLISPHAQNVSENYKCIALYKNTGTSALPIFTYQNDTFLVDRAIDAGTGSYPMLYDYNKDGRPDLFIGSQGYYQSNGSFASKICYYENTIVNGVPALVYQTTDFMGLSAQNFDGAAPAFGDLDNDGKDDMVIGHTDGTISFYKNIAASNTVTPQWQLSQLSLTDSAGPIDVGHYSAPFIYDINKDFKPDLLVANQSGTVYFYQNNGTTGQVKLKLITNKLGGMQSDQYNTFSGFGTLFIGKMDNTGLDYILLGNDVGTVLRYHGFQNGNVTTPYNLIDTTYSHIDVGQRSAVTVGDINGDGKYEMIIGNQLGGLQQYKQVLDVSTRVGQLTGVYGECMLYPNPASTIVNLSWGKQFSGNDPVAVEIINLTGQKVLETIFPAYSVSGSLPVSTLANGVYICVARSNGQTFAQRFLISR